MKRTLYSIERRRIIQYATATLACYMTTGVCRATHAQDINDLPDSIKNDIINRQAQIENVFEGQGMRGSPAATLAGATVLSEQSIMAAAQEYNITATDDEISVALTPYLSKQGLIDAAQFKSIDLDENIKNWVDGQSWTIDDLRHFGRVLALWMKIAVRDIEVTTREVEVFISKNPRVRLLPERVQLKVTEYRRSDGKAATRGIAQAHLVNPISSVTRGDGDGRPLNAVKSLEWERILLYLQTDRLDPNVLRALAGKQPGQKFGPTQAKDGAVVSGELVSILPVVDLSHSDAFFPYAIFMTRLDKSHQQETFNKLVDKYINLTQNPIVRGFFGNLFGLIGTGIGSLLGGVGAPLGAVVGQGFGGIIDGQMSRQAAQRLAPASQFVGAINEVVQPYFNGQSNVSLPPYRTPYFNPYQNGFPQAISGFTQPYFDAYNTFALNAWQQFQRPPQWAPPLWTPFAISM